MEPLPPGACLRSATGISMEACGLTSCLVRIGRKMYAQSFIVCNKMMTNVIVGRDFLSTYKLSITWGDEGTMEVLEGQEPVIRTGEVHQYPTYVGGRARVPPRTVAAVPAIANLPPFGRKTLFRFVPLKENLDLQMKLCSVSFGLCHLEGWPSTHCTTNNQFSRGASITRRGDPARVL